MCKRTSTDDWLLRLLGVSSAVPEFLVFAVVLTAIAVLIGLGYGIHALRLMRDQLNHNHASLRLAALNLLEPSVTIAILLTVGFATVAFNSSEVSPLLLIAGIPLTAMLLAPLLNARAAQPLRGILVMYGVLRWVNTVAFWAVGVAALSDSSSNDKAALAGLLMCSGIVILFVSVAHIASSLNSSQVAPKS